MTDLGNVWKFTRFRLDQAVAELTDRQLRWKPHRKAHSGYELLYHIAGAEHYWASRLSRRDPAATEYDKKLDFAVLDGFLRDGNCPFTEADFSRDKVDEALLHTYKEIEPIFDNPTDAQLNMRLISPVGDEVSGREGLTRLAQHAGYHTGQIWLYRMDPKFPAK